jgi:hypothetical protein
MIDPEYAYLLNGVVMLENSFKVDFIDSPGTTIEVLSACIIKIFHVFRNDDLAKDLISNPEIYLRIISLSLMVSLLVLLFTGGYLIYRKTNNLSLAMFFQSTPLFYGISHYMARILPEAVGVILVIALVFIIVLYIEDQNNQYLENKFSLYSGVLVAAVLATKISFFPLFFLPLFIIARLRHRLYYLFSVIFFFSIFAYPVIVNFNDFFKWMKAILTHTGKYGYGNPGFVNWEEFITNASRLINFQKIAFYLLVINILVLLFSLLVKFSKLKLKSSSILRIISGLTLAIILQTIMVSKHFALHYFLPVLLLSSLNIYLLIKFACNQASWPFMRLIEKSIFLIPLIFVLHFVHQYAKGDTAGRYQAKEYRKSTINFIQNYKTDLPIVIASDAWTPYPEFGLWFGSLFTRKYRHTLVERLEDIYPNRYFYVDHQKCFIDWKNNEYQLKDILNKHGGLCFYYNRQERTMDSFYQIPGKHLPLKVTALFNNPSTNECLVEIQLP